MEQSQDLVEVDEVYIERTQILETLCRSDVGIAFLRWLHRMTGFGRPVMNMEDATRRDFWITIRPYIPTEKLGEIEHEDLRERQRTVRTMIQEIMDQQYLQKELEQYD